MRNMNTVFLIGNLVKDPEMKTTAIGVSVCRFCVAVDRPYKIDGKTKTDFINIVAWSRVADNVGKYLKKGDKCAVIGTMQNSSYDAQDGTKRNITEVVANNVFPSVKKDEIKTESAPVDDSVQF